MSTKNTVVNISFVPYQYKFVSKSNCTVKLVLENYFHAIGILSNAYSKEELSTVLGKYQVYLNDELIESEDFDYLLEDGDDLIIQPYNFYTGLPQ